MQHIDALIPEYVLGVLDEKERLAVEQHLAACSRCAAEALSAEEALASFAFATLAPVAPSGEARHRLVAATRPVEPRRKLDFLERLASFFDVSLDTSRALLEKASNPASWEPAAFPGLSLMHLLAGPKWAGADAGFVRFVGGTPFPLHDHLGDEYTFMLEGGVTFDDGRRFGPGEELYLKPGQKHSFEVWPEGCFYATVLYEGIEIPGIGKVPIKK